MPLRESWYGRLGMMMGLSAVPAQEGVSSVRFEERSGE
jgi:hypothetical protein